MLTEAQKQARRTGIGSSDIAAIVGKSPFASPLDVYLSKVEGFDREGTFSTELGDLLEDPVLTLYERRAKPEVLARHPGTWRHPKLPFVVDTPDALASWDLESVVAPVEAKTSRFSDFETWGEEGTDEVPENYLIQATWHLIVTRALKGNHVTRCDLPVLIRTDEFRIYRIDWNEDLAGMLLDEAARFWRDHIERKEPPDLEGSRTVHDFLKERFPRDSGELLKASEDDEQALIEFFMAHAACKQAESVLDAAKARLQLRIGDASGLVGGAGQVTWKKAKDTETKDWEGLARRLLETVDADSRALLLSEFHLVKPGSRRFIGKPAK